MMARRGFMGLLASAATVVLAGCGKRSSLRYKMVVEVLTPQGLRRGEAVREIVTRDPPPIPALGESRTQVSVRGEAVAVDLPDGRTLFALLRGANGRVDYASQDIKTLIQEFTAGAPGGVIELWPAMPQTQRPKIGNPLPLLVIFEKPNDPTSVKQVDPEAFGVTSITVEASNDPVTVGIRKALPWIGKYPESRLDSEYRGSAHPNLSQLLSYADFVRGPNK